MDSLSSTNIPIQTMSSILDINSPYHVHPSDNPALPLVTPLLNGQNYHQWARAMESIIWIKKAHEVWEDLKERFSQGNLYRIGDLQDSLSNFKQGELTVSNYYIEVKTIWDELDNLRPLPVCNCVDPTICTAETGANKNCEEDRIIKFLKGLNDAYSGVRSQIMVMEPLPSMSKVLSLVTQQETQLYGLDIDAKAMVVTGNWKKGGTQGRGSIQGRRPPNSHGRGSWIKGASPGKYCSHCKKTGHTVEEEGQQQQTGSKNDQDGTIFGLTQQQYQGLVNMLQQNSSIIPKHEDHNVGHDKNTLRMIGTAKMIKGLYMLKAANFHHKANSCYSHDADIDIWHFRLGHTSENYDNTRFTWIYMLKNKSEVSSLLRDFVTIIENQFSNRIKVVRTDNGKEFLMGSYYSSQGIVHQTSCPYTPQ
ncbi:PREDICTED: uncharacterized protein LOC109330924 [Lupinus angustifolius]|uniref:uncharacterized protein LOC109330924 n=1 Tax=Lupinus angustifolius TaxID=3871 RepID=UPI00092E8390|nr:PREDICTED: uncharacterized protein LOC109330924 [Lupinus angustifolius]